MNLANKITIARIGLIPLFLLFMHPFPIWASSGYNYGMILAAALFLIAAATDKLDGYVARKYNQITNLGKLLDPLADKLLIAAALIMLVQEHQVSTWIAFVIIGREIVVTMVRLVATAKGIILAADRYGKVKLVVQVAAITAALLDNYPFKLITSFPIDDVLMLAAAGLTLYSGYNYLRLSYKSLI